jgi:hypothetical protein
MENTTDTRFARNLLAGGMLAGPLYIFLGLVQIIIRSDFDPTRHSLSLMSNGDLGWIQIGNFLLTGLLVIAGAIGSRHVLHNKVGGFWGPLLLGLFGLGLIGSGIFVADPMHAFPPGTPAGPPVEPTTSGMLHIVTGSLGFLGLIAACFVFARHFALQQQRNWAAYSVATGVIFLAGFIGIAAGSQQTGTALQVVTLAFTMAVILGWAWISLVMAQLMKYL